MYFEVKYVNQVVHSGEEGSEGGGGFGHPPGVPLRTVGVLKEGEIDVRNPCHHQQVYDVPEEAPTNLPEGEDEGYPMLIYQFMHAQVPLSSCSRLVLKT